ncbi:MAG: type I DNA topoisomerase [Clostridia bacterium]|nr:type I DNA topoisomerase [Clostridia bacterium]
MASTHLVIVESPSKAGTIKSYLGSSYKVVASVGHVRDLPKSTLGIDIENNFDPHYINIRGKGTLIKSLIAEAKKADVVYLATDPDREGEAISWHLASTLKIPLEKTKRITFNEISKNAVKAAIKAPRSIDMDLVNSQQARRILDRIVGYKLSPFLWKSVRSGLSAGRVQSAAVKILTERENEIKNFVPVEYWTLTANLQNSDGKPFQAKFWGDTKKKELNSKNDVEALVASLGDTYTVKSVKKSLKLRNPAPPFITSTLQQEAYRKLGFSSSKTMKIAQELYEGINLGSALGGTHGLITYMRTDSLRIADSARENAKTYILSEYGEEFIPSTPRIYKASSGSQDAHEAIRPVSIDYSPKKIKKSLTSDQFKLYLLIWDRFIASQMASASFDTVNADIENNKMIFKASGSTLKFKGFLALYEEGTDSAGENDEYKSGTLPVLNEGDLTPLSSLSPIQHFTEAPPRFTEATLIKFLEEKRIGRPSTYATIINTIITRSYVKREGKMLVPTGLAQITTDVITKYFPEIVDYKFTANMEDDLDSIETGSAKMVQVLSKFYDNFARELDVAMNETADKKIEIPQETTDIICDKCGATMVVKSGRFGKFAACPNYPQCKNTKPLAKDGKNEKKESSEPELTDKICSDCGAPLLLREGKFGKFYACSNFPACSFTLNMQTTLDVPCPKCGKDVIVRRGKKRTFYGCSGYPDCDFSSWDMPTKEICPKCGEMLYYKKAKNMLLCHTLKCGFKKESTEESGEN